MSLVAEYTDRPARELLASDRVLAVVAFDGGQPCPDMPADPRHIASGLLPLAQPGMQPGVQPSMHEVWRIADDAAGASAAWGWDGPVRWARSGETLFAALTVDASPARDIERDADDAWTRLLHCIAARGCPHILRAWNYIPAINRGEGDAERYKRFCAGRARAFAAHGYARAQYPAATAVGNDSDALIVHLFASAAPGRHIENPRQVSAYAYPRRYGPQPPSFARATAKTWPSGTHVYLSGTAGIVGHRSCRPGDAEGQLDIAFANVDALLGAINGGGGGGGQSRQTPDLLRVYVRDAADLPRIMERVEQLAPRASVAYVRADICRAELAVEIEGVQYAAAETCSSRGP